MGIEMRPDTFRNWKGGKTIGGKGYIYVWAPYHPYSSKTGYVMEHRLAMEKHVKRFLRKDEHVHHVNGIREDNRLENLELMDNKEHNRFHAIRQGLGKYKRNKK